MYKNIIFDLGNVVLDYNPKVYLKNKLNDTKSEELVLDSIFKSKEWPMLDRGTITEEVAIKNIVSRNIESKDIIELAFENWYEMLTPLNETVDIIKELKEFGVNVLISDPLANSEEVLQQYNLTLTDINEISNLDALIIAVSHDFYKLFSLDSLNKFFNPSITPVLIDVKGLFEKDKAKNLNYLYWRL